MTNALALQPSQKQHQDPYLRLQIAPDTQALIPMKQMQEVLIVPVERITPIPNMPDCVIGLLNQRSRVFWIVSLSELLDLTVLDSDIQEYNIAIVRVGKLSMGLVVQQVHGVIRLSEDTISPPVGTVLPGLAPYLRGCVLHQNYGILLVLDPSALINATVLQQ